MNHVGFMQDAAFYQIRRLHWHLIAKAPGAGRSSSLLLSNSLFLIPRWSPGAVLNWGARRGRTEVR